MLGGGRSPIAPILCSLQAAGRRRPHTAQHRQQDQGGSTAAANASVPARAPGSLNFLFLFLVPEDSAEQHLFSYRSSKDASGMFPNVVWLATNSQRGRPERRLCARYFARLNFRFLAGV